MKGNRLPQNGGKMRRVGLLYIFTNLFNARFNQDELDSHVYLCISPLWLVSHIL